VHNLEDAKKWINIAERDYAVSITLNELHNPLPVEVICFHCQQSVEKSLKAILAYNNAEIPKTHDIRLLNELCQKFISEDIIESRVAETITDFAVETRYVEDNQDYTKDNSDFALKQAKEILENVKEILKLPQDSEVNINPEQLDPDQLPPPNACDV
jgi:HEPN domain-containing protein